MPERGSGMGGTVPKPTRRPPAALSIAGLDPSGGAGLLADARTFDAVGVWGMGVCASVTYQSTAGIYGRFDLPPDVVRAQLEALLEDVKPGAVKTGVIGRADTIREVAGIVTEHRLHPLVADPVIAGGEGSPLLEENALGALVEALLPLADIVTPNAREISAICGFGVFDVEDAEAAALRVAGMGAGAVLVTGLEIKGAGYARVADLLYIDGGFELFERKRVATERVHGTGCVLSAALAALLARGHELKDAAREAGDLAHSAILGAARPGSGVPCANPGSARRSR